MKKNKTILLISLIIPFLTIFLRSYVRVSPIRHSLGFPVKFISYIGKNPPKYIFQLFFPENLKQISFEVGNYIISVVIIYWSIKLLFFITNRLYRTKRLD
ncbi:hypothetical protein SAMN05446037_105318 [Anaerovirgula multivorans]|uniref:Uncharacterized protein n=1 Tax=Anaerovirgula multivorans TaxID=312168 RepID=A0A239KUP9_9FIRM|nr:hypothetical protein SAMN05446037_105318 [Anaerovirgula multivorans]